VAEMSLDSLYRYVIQRHAEETHCDYCGSPLYVGDSAFLDDQTGKVYCTKNCHKRDQPVVFPIVTYFAQDLP